MSIRRAVVLGVLLAGACRPATPTTPPGAATAEEDPRDVTRPGEPPPMYRPGSDGPRMAITRNAYGRYRYAPNAPQMSDTLPDFELPAARGGTWSLKEARAKGPVVIVFYRGFW